jgi:hypothetical protein
MTEKRYRILVAVDGSNQSLDAVGYVSRMLRPDTAEIVLFNVMRDIKDAFRDVGADPLPSIARSRISLSGSQHRKICSENLWMRAVRC